MFKIGHGIDFHRFDTNNSSENSFIILGGVHIPYKYKIIAHSDGDVLIHSLVDAILGAIGAGDIGVHFPPNDNKWKDADSAIFLTHAALLMKKAEYNISNIDITVLSERPKIMPHAKEIIQNLANILEIRAELINIKATTTEKMGSIGRGEGVCADSIILLYKN